MTDSSELSSTNEIQANRETIERSLGEIAAQLNSALIEARVVYRDSAGTRTNRLPTREIGILLTE